jgi:hypothetical protein
MGADPSSWLCRGPTGCTLLIVIVTYWNLYRSPRLTDFFRANASIIAGEVVNGTNGEWFGCLQSQHILHWGEAKVKVCLRRKLQKEFPPSPH